jgi:predicted dithiol-disulfide oxidoreductase (DUF899 family)
MPEEAVMGIKDHAVVSRDEWLSARTAFLAKEKEFTRLRDDLSRQRRELPWVKVDKSYVFDGPGGKESLAGLFGDHSQLIVYHFMFTPSWDEGCRHCSRPSRNAWGGASNGSLRARAISTLSIKPRSLRKS